MRATSLLLSLAVLAAAAGAVRAQDEPLPEPLPPPAMDDPPEEAALLPEPLAPPDPPADTTLVDDLGAATGPVDADAPLPPKVLAPDEPAPAVTIRTDADTGDVIEEYRQNGVVYMVRVRPERGPEYLLLDTNGDGRLDQADGEGAVRPVYWTLYEWE
jgi:hypothetical protein